MRATKLVLSILGVAMATISFGQLLSLQEISSEKHLSMGLHLNDYCDVLFYSADFNEEQGRMEHWLNNIPGNAYQMTFADDYQAPDIFRAYFAKDVEVTYDEGNLLVESWMTTPFESPMFETEIWVESWMVTPFDEELLDEESVEMEVWMTSKWI
jgi:hypothetical protein